MKSLVLKELPKVMLSCPRIFIHDPTGNIFFLQTHVVITGVVIAPGAAAAGEIANVHRRLTIDTQAFDVGEAAAACVFFLILSKMASVCAIFFCGFALTTLRSRKPSRLSTVAIVLGAGNCSAS